MGKKIQLIGLLLIISSSICLNAQDMLGNKFTLDELGKIVIPYSKWMAFPKIEDRQGWSKADQQMLKTYYDEALKYVTYQWPPIPATTTLMFARTGNRSEYEAISFQKRRILGTLLLGEIYENKGRFTDQIIDGVWSICEETYWGVNSTVGAWHAGIGLPDISDPYVDLFVAETATYLSLVDYFMGEKLDAVSPQVRKRIYYETNTRFFVPAMTYDLGWMGFNRKAGRPNNWNPWICSNWLITALLLERNDSRRVEMVNRILKTLDNFLSPYPQDGGCDEGPGYWNVAGGSLFDNLQFLNMATNNAFQYVFNDEKVKNMGRYVYNTQISEKYCLNFADASPRLGGSGPMIWRYGKAIGDEKMQQYGAFYKSVPTGRVGSFQFFRVFFDLFQDPEYNTTAKALPLPKEAWFPNLQVMVARDKEGSTDGFFIAAKGGHNAESHNHNDVGSFVVYYNGLPVLIDVGSGTYTAKTFNSHRYEIWSNCSDYHNLPTINGITQSPGAQFKALNAAFTSSKSYSQVLLDISHAYPETAGVTKLQRTVRLNRGKNVEINDEMQFTKPETFFQSYMTCYKPEVGASGQVVIHSTPLNARANDFVIKYNPDQFKAEIEKVALDAPEDKGVISNWGDNVYRIKFTAVSAKSSAKSNFQISVK
jgi:Heparinase II/III-like protein